MRRKLDRGAIEAPTTSGVRLLVSFDAPGGGMEGIVPSEEIVRLIEGPDGWFATRRGVTKTEHRDGIEAEGPPRRGARTKRGVRCRNPVSGRIQRDLHDWLRHDRGFCIVHGGPSAKDASRERWSGIR